MTFPDSITVISDEISQDLPDLIRFTREFRLPGLELRSLAGRAFKDLTHADVAEFKRAAQGEGWKVFGCATPVFKCEIDDASAVRAHVEEFRRSLGVAQELGTDLLRIFTFLRRPASENAALLPRVAEQLEELRRIAGGSGVRIGIENEHSCLVATGEEAAALIAMLPDPQFGLVWDPCNVLYVPGSPADVTAAFPRFASRVFHVHVKDAVRAPAKPGGLLAVATPVGLGDVGWRAHLATLAAHGYRGMLSLETHWRVVQIAEEDLHLPAGYGFSRGGEEATRTCLHNVRALLPDR